MFLPSYEAVRSHGVYTAFDADYIAFWQERHSFGVTLFGLAEVGKRMQCLSAAKKGMDNYVGFQQSCEKGLWHTK